MCPFIKRFRHYLYKMDKKHQDALTIDKYHELVVQAIDKYAITNFSKNHTFDLRGKSAIPWLSYSVSPILNSSPDVSLRLYHQKFSDDLDFLSDELQFIIGEMYMYRDFIRNPIGRPSQNAGGTYYAKDYNIAEKRYDMLVNQAAQVCYNIWDRIGDLINTFFPGMLGKRNVYFKTVIPAIDSKYHTANYDWLKNFADNEFKKFNDLRLQIVHFEVPATTDMHKHLGSIFDKAAIEVLHKEKMDRADYFKDQADKTIDGLYYALSFLDDVIAYNKINGITIY